MSDEISSLLADVDKFLAVTGMSPSTLGRKAVNDGKCIGRLRNGGRAWPETISAIRVFMRGARRSKVKSPSRGAA